jgi:hypothetical protein
MNGLTLAAGAFVVSTALALRGARNWGASPQEVAAVLPGDELVPEPGGCTTRAVDIDAPAEEVWRWLVQMGQGRGGMFSYDWLENVVGHHAHTTYQVREGWQDLAVGDRIRVLPESRGPLPDGLPMTVARLEEGRLLVLRQAPPECPRTVVWSFVIEPLDRTSCRLLSRSLAGRPASRVERLAAAALEPLTTIMTRRMLLGIKQRAESAVWPFGAEPQWEQRTVEDGVPTPGVPAASS